jgi:hypothetical protein
MPSNLPILSFSRSKIEFVRVTPTLAQMIPQTRHYTNRTKIFAEFESFFEDFNEFVKLNPVSELKLMKAEIFSRKWYLPGAQFWAAPYQLKDAVSLGALALSPSNSLGTRSAMLFHFNHKE